MERLSRTYSGDALTDSHNTPQVWDLDALADGAAFIVAESEAQLRASRGAGGGARLRKGTGYTDIYEITGPEPREYVAHMVGTTSVAKGSFTWAWGYRPGEETGETIVHGIRRQGELLGVEELARDAFVSEPRVLQRVLQAAAAISRTYTPAAFQTEGGDTGYFLVSGFELPPAQSSDLQSAIESVMVGDGRPHNIRRALEQYAATRRIGHADQPGGVILAAEDGHLVIGLSPEDQIVGFALRDAEQPPPKRGLFKRS